MDIGSIEHELEKRLQGTTAELPMSLTLEYLELITNNFSEDQQIGQGAYGVVYKGVLIGTRKAIAIKKIIDKHLCELNQFENEITCFMRVRHQNVVRLVGYCVQTRSEVMELSGKHILAGKPACLLCFEFLSMGSLHERICDDTSDLDWDKRYKIIRGICRGLHYLHDKCYIVHLDLKPQNILMDDMMTPKIADFGLSRLLGQEKSGTFTEKLQGTLGYMAPECIEQRGISFEADIFSLGVIIIEIITGSTDYPQTSERTETYLKLYTDKVVGSWRNRIPMHLQQVEQCISIALKCLEHDSKKRPTSLGIVLDLDALDPESGSVGNSPSDAEKERRNQNLRKNECANISQLNKTHKGKFQGEVRQLQGDHQCLSDILPAMYNLIDRAEWRVHDNYVADLLSKLKDAVYDAEDLLDEFRWYETKVSLVGNVISLELTVDFFHRVTEGSYNTVTCIQKRLKELSTELEKLVFPQEILWFDKSIRPETTSFPTEAKIFGRDKEKKKLIRSLLGLQTNNSMGPSGRKRKRSGVSLQKNNRNEATRTRVPEVLPIVGIGGVGKTTLAQDICNDPKVKHHFEPIIWICVSDDFDVKRLTKEAIEQSSGKVPKNDNLNSLQNALANSLSTKRFLIVLDDMWHEKKHHWNQFRAPFKNVHQESMILITTRSQKVADVVHTVNPFHLEGLNQDVFQEFFNFCVFGSDGSNNDPELKLIGEEILQKLKGSPLAAKTLGRLLGMSLNRAHWDRILKSELWELQQEETDILPALRLSYMHLPFYLKRCFSFCAVYPKDYIFKKDDLAEIWAAEGLVEHQHTGDQNFEELVHLSFFQKYPQSHEKYVMHDLMHDMARQVSKDECFIIKDTKDLAKIPQNVRHLSVLKCEDVKCSCLLDLCKHTKLRTLLCDLSLQNETDNSVMENWCAKLRCMRVMICSSISNQGLPNSIYNMKHLRYLKIMESCPWKRLPLTFCSLYNMQVVYAKKWEIDEIPSGFGNLMINLRKFESLKYEFYNIQSVDIREGASATDEGQSRQFKLRNYNGESLPSGFHPQNLPYVTSLWFGHWGNVKSLSFSMNPQQIHGHASTDSTFTSVTSVEISQCPSLESVPNERFADLPFLEVLSVLYCSKIKSECLSVPSLKKLYLKNSGNLGCSINCSSLTILHLSGYPLESIDLENWDLPSLLELKVTCCPSLTIIRDSKPASTDPSHSGARSITGKLQQLTHLTIRSCDKLETIDDLSLTADRLGSSRPLKDLEISMCPTLNWQSGVSLPSSLQKLTLSSCGDFSAWFPESLKNLTTLESLEIRDCRWVESVPGQLWSSALKSLQRLIFTNCAKLTSIGGRDAIAHVENVLISGCPELKEFDQPKFRKVNGKERK